MWIVYPNDRHPHRSYWIIKYLPIIPRHRTCQDRNTATKHTLVLAACLHHTDKYLPACHSHPVAGAHHLYLKVISLDGFSNLTYLPVYTTRSNFLSTAKSRQLLSKYIQLRPKSNVIFSGNQTFIIPLKHCH